MCRARPRNRVRPKSSASPSPPKVVTLCLAALVANGLVQGSSSQLLLSVVGFAPQGTSSSRLQQDLAPELASAQWLQLSGS